MGGPAVERPRQGWCAVQGVVLLALDGQWRRDLRMTSLAGHWAVRWVTFSPMTSQASAAHDRDGAARQAPQLLAVAA